MKSVILYSPAPLPDELLEKLAELGVEVQIGQDSRTDVAVLGGETTACLAIHAELERRHLSEGSMPRVVIITGREAGFDIPDISTMMADLSVPGWPALMLENEPRKAAPHEAKQPFHQQKHYSPKHQGMAAKSRR